MFSKSIYKTLLEDFSFVKDYGFDFQFYVKSNTNPAILYKGKRYVLNIGYSCGYNQEEGFFVRWSDSIENLPQSKENLDRIAKYDPQSLNFFKYGIPQYNDLLESVTLIGKTYKEQVGQVKDILLEFLQKFKQ